MHMVYFPVAIHFSVIFFCTILFTSPQDGFALLPKERAKQVISTIPMKDREILDKFFRNLCFFYEFAYTLFGDKPISIEFFDLDKEELFHTSAEGYMIWSKYANLFPSQKHIFLFYENKEQGYCEITLINKDSFRITTQNHLMKFAEVFGQEISPDKLLELIVEKRSLHNTPIGDRADLIGILLGYGKNNAELFQKRNEILMRGTGIRKKRIKPSQGYKCIEEELDALNACLKSFSSEGRISLNYMRLPGFAADPELVETKRLRKKYIDQRRRITQRFIQNDVLETIMEQLCAGE